MPDRLRGVFTTRRYTNPRLPSPLPYLMVLNPVDEPTGRVTCHVGQMHHINHISQPKSCGVTLGQLIYGFRQFRKHISYCRIVSSRIVNQNRIPVVRSLRDLVTLGYVNTLDAGL